MVANALEKEMFPANQNATTDVSTSFDATWGLIRMRCRAFSFGRIELHVFFCI